MTPTVAARPAAMRCMRRPSGQRRLPAMPGCPRASPPPSFGRVAFGSLASAGGRFLEQARRCAP
eukprot:15434577-Alexandrium_andersonii.AAC.1